MDLDIIIIKKRIPKCKSNLSLNLYGMNKVIPNIAASLFYHMNLVSNRYGMRIGAYFTIKREHPM